MAINWIVFFQIAAPVVAAVFAALISRYLSGKERLIAFYGHIASHAFNSLIEGEEVTHINTHAVVIRNAGNKTATNVKINHNVLPDFKIYPETDYKVKELPGGGKELLIPRLTPKKELTISYLYFAPLTYNEINSSIESDVGPAKVINVRLQQIFPKWVNFLVGFLMIFGFIALIYLGYEVIRGIYFWYVQQYVT